MVNRVSGYFPKGGNAATQTELITRIDVYETLCPQQMLVNKGGQINNAQLMTGVGSAEMLSHLHNCSVKISKDHSRYYTKKRNKQLKTWGGGHGGCQPRTEVIVKMPKKKS